MAPLVVSLAVVAAPELSVRGVFGETHTRKVVPVAHGHHARRTGDGTAVPTKWMPMLAAAASARLNVPPASATAPEPRAKLLVISHGSARDGRAVGIGVGAREGQRAGANLLETAGAGKTSGERQIIAVAVEGSITSTRVEYDGHADQEVRAA